MYIYMCMYSNVLGSYMIHNRTIEDLYEELVRQGIIVQYPKTRLSEFAGEFRYVCTCT